RPTASHDSARRGSYHCSSIVLSCASRGTAVTLPAGYSRSMASPAGWRTLPKRPRAVFRTFPFTLSAFAVILLVGLISGTMWDALRDRSLLHHVAYGLPALEHGRWWTPVTGSVYALQPSGYIAALLVFVILVGFAEWRLGTRTTAIATVAMQ